MKLKKKKLVLLCKNKPKAKLTKEDVIKIRYMAEQENKKISEIYEYYIGKCTRNTIKRVITYQT